MRVTYLLVSAFATLLLLNLVTPELGHAQTKTDEDPYVVESYYKVTWGHQAEFLELYKRNHQPVLQRALEAGHILDVQIERPLGHLPEEARWDYRVTVTFRSAAVSVSDELDATFEAAKRDLYPDQERFRDEERRRFQLLAAHWDVPVVSVSTDQ